jgi:hypothetical protein
MPVIPALKELSQEKKLQANLTYTVIPRLKKEREGGRKTGRERGRKKGRKEGRG